MFPAANCFLLKFTRKMSLTKFSLLKWREGERERERERPTCISMLFKLMCSSLGSLRFFPPSATTWLQYLFHTSRFL